MPPSRTTTAWGVVVPVKLLAIAKSRLASYGDPAREQLALAFAADVVTACLACPGVARVLVVTDDPRAGQALTALGAVVAPDDPDAGLNPALAHGAELLRAALGVCGVVTVSSDLPTLRPTDLAAALAVVPPLGRAFVPDADARGTTLLAAGPGAGLLPAYGAGSRQRHLSSGAVELAAPAALRRDVDTPGDLAEAVLLGVGRRTAAVVATLPGPRIHLDGAPWQA